MIKITSRTLAIAMLLQVKNVKFPEEINEFQKFLAEKFGDKVQFWYCDERSFKTLVFNTYPFAVSEEDPKVPRYSIIPHPDYNRGKEVDLNFWLRAEVVGEKDRKFFLEKFPQVVREFYEKNVPDGKNRLL